METTKVASNQFPYGNVLYTKFNSEHLDMIRRNPAIVQQIEDELITLSNRLSSIDTLIIKCNQCNCHYIKLQETRTSILIAKTNLENLVNAALNNIREWYMKNL